ncbi:MAG: hypothetical protein QOI67_75 [Gaiellaceae bacterium]|jgi:hypothetical protein|nr:hypothetical protein [Gaiellaceae bacterium]
MRKRGPILIVACAALLAVAPAQGRVADHNPARTTDVAGDSGGAPDITGVTIANDLSGNVLFVIQVGNREGFVAKDLVAIFLDTDRSVGTGGLGAGIDYIIGIDAAVPAIGLARWTGTAFEDVVPTTLRGGWGAGYAALINKTELGNTTAFDFQVVTQLDETDGFDRAPETAFGTYTIAPPHIASIVPRFSPTAPRGGATFRLQSVALAFESEEKGVAASFTCRATLAGKRVKGTGAGGCTFKLPKTAKGKQLVVTVSATPTGGKAQTFPAYKFRVR